MEFVQKIADFIMYLIRTIKDLVASFTGKNEEETTGAKYEVE